MPARISMTANLLSLLQIDVDKDWVAKRITNLGAPIVGTDSARKTEVDTHAGTTSGIHGVTGDIVGTTDTQILSNKTISDKLILQDSVDLGTSAGHILKIFGGASEGVIQGIGDSLHYTNNAYIDGAWTWHSLDTTRYCGLLAMGQSDTVSSVVIYHGSKTDPPSWTERFNLNLLTGDITSIGKIAPGSNEALEWDMFEITVDGTSPDSISGVIGLLGIHVVQGRRTSPLTSFSENMGEFIADRHVAVEGPAADALNVFYGPAYVGGQDIVRILGLK